VSRYQKGKTTLDFTEARDCEWLWHQLGHMQVCTLLQTDNHASTPPLSFLQAGCPFCRPKGCHQKELNVSEKWTVQKGVPNSWGSCRESRYKVNWPYSTRECRRDAHLPVLSREPIGGWTTSLWRVAIGQCDAKPSVTLPAAGHHRPLTGTKLYCLVTEAHVREQLAQGCCWKARTKNEIIFRYDSFL